MKIISSPTICFLGVANISVIFKQGSSQKKSDKSHKFSNKGSFHIFDEKFEFFFKY